VLKLAHEMGLPKVYLETDCASAVAKMKGTDKDQSIHGPLVEEIKVLLQGFEEAGVGHVRRACNEVPHKLAKFGSVDKSCNIWVGEPPDFIVNGVATESAGV
jgi:hypothetical protein